jgi:adenine-specific DNA-methyltransferase
MCIENNLRKSLNLAFLKVKLTFEQIECFKKQAVKLLAEINDHKNEDDYKKPLTDFLEKGCFYNGKYRINSSKTNDLVIHNDKEEKSPIGVIFELKRPGNISEMLSCDNLNKKALQELVLYYLRERFNKNNNQIKQLIVTNINEWFVFDAQVFEKAFVHLETQFIDFEQHRLVKNTTDFFYEEIAAPAISNALQNDILKCTYFNLQHYQELLHSTNQETDPQLIPLFKILSPEHLLKLPFGNDNNSLNKEFYDELLHIIGLTEQKGLIQRKEKSERYVGSLLEQIINEISSLEKLKLINDLHQYGSSSEEQLFSIGLELSITWINRILFLKLLESQLVTYHQGNKEYIFLTKDKIKNFSDLNSLFFQILAYKQEEREEKLKNDRLKQSFVHVPYLNSTLFEKTTLENECIAISNLNSANTLPIFKSTVLKDAQGKKRIGELDTLSYLFEFLEAYDFSSEGKEAIQEQNKTLISASVLGLIFEKINGYKDGSFFTPSFITMYMSKEVLRYAVVQKFNQLKHWECKTLNDVYNQIKDKKEANDIINSLKICDPAVGSGHFLVSILNEIIAIKSELEILQDKQGKRLKHLVNIVNDELIITDEEGIPFEYNPNNPQSQRIQETLFHEKQILIEHCLFGVDINPNSVKICQLRLWIELLKHAYYKNKTELETLPNIDINIQCGNSLISRFSLEANLKTALQKTTTNISKFKDAFHKYQHPNNKQEKYEMENLISEIKSNFRTEIYKQRDMLNDVETTKDDSIYNKAFEWRFEFPEALNDDGDFIGFDIVIGNPPYGVSVSKEKEYFQKYYTSTQTIKKIQKGSLDSFSLFIEQGLNLLKTNGILSFIVPMSITSSDAMTGLHNLLENTCQKICISSYSNRPKQIFDNAGLRTSIISFIKTKTKNEQILTTRMIRRRNDDELSNMMSNIAFINSKSVKLKGRYPKISTQLELQILQKLFANGTPLLQFCEAQGKPIYYRTSGGRYFNVITNYPTGSTQEKSIYLQQNIADFIGATLSSNLFYFYQQVYSDGLHIKQSEIEMFCIPNASNEVIKEIEIAYSNYLQDIENYAVRHLTSQYSNITEFKEYKIKKSKHLIDKIDALICPLYDFTPQEIDFIVNYEIKYRLDNESD